jgi:GNAT superfamily N-acetyltransferase
MIRQCRGREYPEIFATINKAALAYCGVVIPEDKWKEPYIDESELKSERQKGVKFQGYYDDSGGLLGVMGYQDCWDVQLIRHAYILPTEQRRGIGGLLLDAIRELASKPLLVGTYTAAATAISFYEKNNFCNVGPDETQRLLSKYWTVPKIQSEQSVVLADAPWFDHTTH